MLWNPLIERPPQQESQPRVTHYRRNSKIPHSPTPTHMQSSFGHGCGSPQSARKCRKLTSLSLFRSLQSPDIFCGWGGPPYRPLEWNLQGGLEDFSSIQRLPQQPKTSLIRNLRSLSFLQTTFHDLLYYILRETGMFQPCSVMKPLFQA